MIAMDDPRHGRLGRLVSAAHRATAARVEGEVGEAAARVIDAVAEKGGGLRDRDLGTFPIRIITT